MLFPDLTGLTDLTLFLLRLMIAAIFVTSGWSHMTEPKERAKSIGMSPTATLVLGVVEVLGALSLVLGIYAQIGSILLMGVMLGAIQKKVFVWKTGVWGRGRAGLVLRRAVSRLQSRDPHHGGRSDRADLTRPEGNDVLGIPVGPR